MEDLKDREERGIGGNLQCLVELFEHFLRSDDAFIWVVNDKVFLDRDWEEFHAAFEGEPADLLCVRAERRAAEGDPNMARLFFKSDERSDRADIGILPCCFRVSRNAAMAVAEGIEAGWHGEVDVILPTLVDRAGLSVVDMGGNGEFTPPRFVDVWYDRSTIRRAGAVAYRTGKLHFPATEASSSVSFDRFDPSQCDPGARLLYISPVGRYAKPLLNKALKAFRDAGADCLLIKYDDSDLEIPEAVKVIKDKGWKWPLAYKHLPSELISQYDFIFFWDDDLDVAGFDPRRFVEIMASNRLEVAQPGITSEFGLSHGITAAQECPLWLPHADDVANRIVGRLTNFVEIMAPVYSRAAWLRLSKYLDVENKSGWGYDFIPFNRVGVVDSMPVVHTRPVQSFNDEALRELAIFLSSHGLFRHAPQNLGWLFST